MILNGSTKERIVISVITMLTLTIGISLLVIIVYFLIR